MNNNLMQNVITEEDDKIIITADNILAKQINVNEKFLVDMEGQATTENLVVNNKLTVNDLDYTNKWQIAINLDEANYQVNLSSWKNEDNNFIAGFFSLASNPNANAYLKLNDDQLIPIYNTDSIPLIGSDVSNKMLFLRYYNNAFYAFTSTKNTNTELYPVGSIYLSTNSINPANYFGGTWVSWGQGRVPLGMGSNGTTNYTIIEATGGSETHTLTTTQIPAHTHYQDSHYHIGATDWAGLHTHSVKERAVYGGGDTYNATSRLGGNISSDVVQSSGNHNHSFTTNGTTATNHNTGGGLSHPNMQPYITCFMWKRVS